jgi:hypothetical protein
MELRGEAATGGASFVTFAWRMVDIQSACPFGISQLRGYSPLTVDALKGIKRF